MHKSSRQFSSIIIDQAIEQANAFVMASGVAFGVSGYPATGPEHTMQPS